MAIGVGIQTTGTGERFGRSLHVRGSGRHGTVRCGALIGQVVDRVHALFDRDDGEDEHERQR